MIQTVLGNINSSVVTAALPHEHVLSDLRPLVAPLDNGIFYDKVSLSNYGALSRNPYALLDNAVLDDKEAAVEEFRTLFKIGFNILSRHLEKEIREKISGLPEKFVKWALVDFEKSPLFKAALLSACLPCYKL